jgi:hypothetical protein
MADRLRGHDGTIGERLERELAAFQIPLPAFYDACEKVPTGVSSLSLVRYRRTRRQAPRLRRAAARLRGLTARRDRANPPSVPPMSDLRARINKNAGVRHLRQRIDRMLDVAGVAHRRLR